MPTGRRPSSWWLGTAGVAALHLVLPGTVSTVVLLALLVTSYRQAIDGYPIGGGAYAVSRANVGSGLARLAAASLMVNFTLTVAVSIAVARISCRPNGRSPVPLETEAAEPK